MGKQRVVAKKFHSDALQGPKDADVLVNASAESKGRGRPSKRAQAAVSDDDLAEDDDQNDDQSQPQLENHDLACEREDASDDEAQPAAEAGPSSSTRQRLLEMLPHQIDEQRLKQLAAGHLGSKLMNQRQELARQQQQQYAAWRFQLRQGFSLLFYGFGSKRRLLEHFATSALTDGGVVAVSGYQAGTTAKHVLAAAVQALTHRAMRAAGCAELLGVLQQEPPERQLYVLVHNIDGPGLRAAEEQRWLAALAALPQVHLLASADHVNAPLLWDKHTAARCRWLWHDVTSYEPYTAETLDTPYILAGAYQQATRRGAGSVLLSLVTSAREVFRVLASHQLEDPACEGVTFQHLYRMCRERFLVSSEQALRQHLTEFRDHDLVRQRTTAAGELLVVPMEAAVLQQVLQQMDAAQ